MDKSLNLYLTFETDYFTVEIFNFTPILDDSHIYKTKINEYAKNNVTIDDYFEYKGGFINEYMKDVCNTANELYKEHYRLVSDYIDLALVTIVVLLIYIITTYAILLLCTKGMRMFTLRIKNIIIKK